jgi:hypothetical protein
MRPCTMSKDRHERSHGVACVCGWRRPARCVTKRTTVPMYIRIHLPTHVVYTTYVCAYVSTEIMSTYSSCLADAHRPR